MNIEERNVLINDLEMQLNSLEASFKEAEDLLNITGKLEIGGSYYRKRVKRIQTIDEQIRSVKNRLKKVRNIRPR